MTRTATSFLLGILASALAALAPAASADKPTPGMYSIDIRMESDMPIPTQSQTMTQCITAEDMEKDPNAFLKGQPGRENCDVSDHSMADGKMTIAMVCQAQGGEMRINTEGTYDATSYRLTTNIQMNGAGMTINMKSTGVGTRIGDC